MSVDLERDTGCITKPIRSEVVAKANNLRVEEDSIREPVIRELFKHSQFRLISSL